MDAQTLTIISGVALLIVFALVGVYMRRRNTRRKSARPRKNKNKR